jgi:hypothetical protein
MGWFDHDDSDEVGPSATLLTQRDAFDQVQNAPREASFGHELIGGAAAFAAMRAYQSHEEATGCVSRVPADGSKPQSFEIAKDIIAGLAGMEVDKLVETKGLDGVDRMRAKHEAEERAKNALAQSGQFGSQDYQRRDFDQGGYGGGGGYGGD